MICEHGPVSTTEICIYYGITIIKIKMRKKGWITTQCKPIKQNENQTVFFVLIEKKIKYKIKNKVSIVTLDSKKFMEGERSITRINFTSKVMTAESLHLLYPRLIN